MAKRGYWKDKEPFMDWGYYDDKDTVEIDLKEFYFQDKNEFEGHLKARIKVLAQSKNIKLMIVLESNST